MPKIFKDLDKPIGYQGLSFYCNGCKRTHTVNFHPNNQWGFNNNFEKPTLTPSVLVSYGMWEPPVNGENIDEWKENPWEQTQVHKVCHSFVTDGNIQYLSDCTHELAGYTIELPEFKWEEDGENA